MSEFLYKEGVKKNKHLEWKERTVEVSTDEIKAFIGHINKILAATKATEIYDKAKGELKNISRTNVIPEKDASPDNLDARLLSQVFAPTWDDIRIIPPGDTLFD